MRRACRQFVVEAEDFLATHPEAAPLEVPPALRPHAAACRGCQARWLEASRSRRLLTPLREQAAAQRVPDPHFLTRVRGRIQLCQAQPSGWRDWLGLNIAARDLVIAAVLFFCTLSAFIYNFHRIERPNADEAMVLDVPHTNPQHPSDDHVRPGMADVMLNLMNP